MATNDMLSLSQTTGYAINALSCLSHERVCLIREVSETTGIAKPYLAKIFNLLTNKGLVTTKRGYHGGILLARPADKIALLQIVEAVDGDGWSSRCLLGMRECNEDNLCPTHDLWAEMKGRIRQALKNITLSEVSSLAAKQHWAVRSHPVTSAVPADSTRTVLAANPMVGRPRATPGRGTMRASV